MGCPDWPKCFGKWIPPTNASELPANFEKYLRKQDIDHTFNALHTWIEYFNRLFGVLLGLFGIIQVLLLFKKRKENTRSIKLAVGFLMVVILTGLFGALVVKLNLAHISISVHLLFALLLVQIQLALLLSLNNKLGSIIIDANLQKFNSFFKGDSSGRVFVFYQPIINEGEVSKFIYLLIILFIYVNIDVIHM
jgi:heme A synthase